MVPPSSILLLPVSYAFAWDGEGGKEKKRKKNIGVILLIFGDFYNVFSVCLLYLCPLAKILVPVAWLWVTNGQSWSSVSFFLFFSPSAYSRLLKVKEKER